MEQTNQPKRVLFIGWDGADPFMISKLLETGKLPALKKLIESGFYKPLRSTIRPESPTAWTSFATGANPGTHGVFGFMRQIPGTYDFVFTNTRYLSVPFFWETLSKNNRRVALLNMPMAYPPRPVNGWIVCGLMTPGNDARFTFPENLGGELLSQGYPIDAEPLQFHEDKKQYSQRMVQQVMKRTNFAVKLLGKLDWDYAAVVYTELDRLQHFFWAYEDATHPYHADSTLSDTIPDHYVVLDNALDRLYELVGPDTHIIIMSDHGFAPCARTFYVNAWLQQKGLLTYKKRHRKSSNLPLHIARVLKQSSLLRQIKRKLLGDQSLVAQLESRSFSKQVDWTKTKAWYAETGGIRINLEGREPQGIVKQGKEYEELVSLIMREAMDIRDQETGETVVKSVYQRDQIYEGPEVGSAPEIIIEPYRITENALRNHRIASINLLEPEVLFSDSRPYTGDHSPAGICASNRLPPKPINHIPDVSRWIMDCFDTPLETTNLQDQGNVPVYNLVDERTLRERLKSLGYID